MKKMREDIGKMVNNSNDEMLRITMRRLFDHKIHIYPMVHRYKKNTLVRETLRFILDLKYLEEQRI